MRKLPNSKLLMDLTAHVWPKIQALGYTHESGTFYRPDGRKVSTYQDLPPLVQTMSQDLTGPEWAWALAHAVHQPVSRIYRLNWALRYTAMGDTYPVHRF